MPIQTCFESEEDRLLFLELRGETNGPAPFSLGSWLSSQGMELHSPEERLKIAQTFSKSKFPAEQWLSTVELLRSSLVLNKEQVIFCFNQLPQTQKNRALRDCFFFYLDSPLSKDLESHIWHLLGILKSNTPEACPFLKNITFVPSTSSPSFLFQEFCEATRYLSDSSLVHIRSLGELFGSLSSSSEPSLQQGPRLRTLDAFAHSIQQWHSHHPDDSIFVSFLGSPRSRDFLKYRLASWGLESADSSSSKASPEKDPWVQLLDSLRKTSDLNLQEKYLLNSILISHRPYQNESLKIYLDRLCSSNLIASPKQKALLALTAKPISNEASSCKIRLIPWIALPEFHKVAHFAFCDESLLEVPPSSFLLSETELECLFSTGFQLPRRSHTLQTRLRILKHYAENWPDRTFSSAKPEDLSGFRLTGLRVSAKLPLFDDSPFTASLPVTNLSATQLETYADCPSKYLFRRLKLSEPALPLSDFALNMGQAVHKTLETLFSKETQPKLDEVVLRRTFSECLTQTLLPSENVSSRKFFYIKAFEKFIARIQHNEAILKKVFSTQRTLAVEKEFKLQLNGIPVIGKIDRVDLMENNQLLILDYKTGSVDFTPDHISQGFNFQALLYWLGAQEAFKLPPAAMIFYDLKKGEVKRGLAEEDSLSPEAKKELTRGHTLKNEKLTSLLDSGLAHLAQLAHSIRSGDFTPKPSAEACRFCEAPSFCRKGTPYA